MHGATLSFLTMLKGLVLKGIDPVVVMPQENADLCKKLKEIGAKVYVVKREYNAWQNIYNWHTVVKYPYLMTKQFLVRRQQVKRLKRIIIDEKIELVHTNVGPIYAGHDAAHSLNIPHVWHIREYGDLDFGIRMLPSKSYFRKKLHQDWVITITNDLLKYNELENCPRACTIYNGVRKKDEVFLEHSRNLQFLCASRVIPPKGHEMVIEAFAEFCKKDQSYSLVILGDGQQSFINHLKQKAEILGCGNRVIFQGRVNNVTDYMKKSKALIVASVSEGFGRMTAEAAFAGCPVIGRNTGGTKEILETTGGFLFNDEEELLNCMIKMAKIPNEEYFSMIVKAQKMAKELYSEESYVEKVYDVYKKALKYQGLNSDNQPN